MKPVLAAATFVLAASAFALPSWGQKRTAVEQPASYVPKHYTRNKPVNLPRNKSPAHKAATHPAKQNKVSKPKKASSASTQKKASTSDKKTSAKSTTDTTEEEVDDEEKQVGPEEKEVGDVEGEDKTVEGDADKEVSETEHDTDKETVQAENTHARRANKPQPKAAPKSKPAAAHKPESKTAKKAAAKPASKPTKKPAQKPATEEIEDDEEEEAHELEGDADVDPEHVEPTEEVEHEEGNAGKVHPRAQAKVNGSKPKPKGTAQHATTQPKKAAAQPKKAASTGKKASAQGAPFAQISTVEKTVESKLHARAGKAAPKKAATAPKKAAPKKAAAKPKKAAAHKSPATAKTPVTQVDDNTPLNVVSKVAQTATSKLHARDETAPTDVQILQYALTLEHLENAFYSGALEKFNQQAFVKGGLPSFARKRFEQIAEHEAAHVAFLTSALGDSAVDACEYDFPYTDPKSFAALSMVLEGVGVSAYLGAAQFIQNKDYLTAAGSILTTESRHAAWVASAVEKDAPWSGAFDIPLSFNDVYSLAAPFITSCPSSNPALPFKAFPKLSVKTENYKAGDTISLDFDDSEADGEPIFLALFDGLNTTYIAIEDNNEATLPSGLEGTVYGVITTNGTSVNDENTIAGVAILDFYANY